MITSPTSPAAWQPTTVITRFAFMAGSAGMLTRLAFRKHDRGGARDDIAYPCRNAAAQHHAGGVAVAFAIAVTAPVPTPVLPRNEALPPSDAQAKAALDSTPRHGEYVNVDFPAGKHEAAHLRGVSGAQGEGTRRDRHPRGLRPQRLAARCRRPAREGRVHRGCARPHHRPRARRRRHRVAAEPRRRGERDPLADAGGRHGAPRRGARLGAASCRPPTADRPPSASAGAARAVSPTQPRSPAWMPPSSTTARRPTPRRSQRSRRRSSASTAATMSA